MFSVKEHVLITLIAAAAGGRPLAVDNIVVQRSELYLVLDTTTQHLFVL